MALLDVSEILIDPDFVDSLTVTTVNQTIGSNGIATETTTNAPFIGVVTQADGDIMDRFPDYEMVRGSIVVHTKYRLSDGGAGRNADRITWQGRQYTVKRTADYSNYGAGFISAVCDLIPVTG